MDNEYSKSYGLNVAIQNSNLMCSWYIMVFDLLLLLFGYGYAYIIIQIYEHLLSLLCLGILEHKRRR